MKKLITLSLLLFTSFVLRAQTAEETLEWLLTKQSTINRVTSDDIKTGGDLKIDEAAIKVLGKEKTIKIEWNKIKDVRLDFRNITIVSNDLVDGKNVFFVLLIDLDIAQKYVKALKHFATLKGAKMVKDDMF